MWYCLSDMNVTNWLSSLNDCCISFRLMMRPGSCQWHATPQFKRLPNPALLKFLTYHWIWYHVPINQVSMFHYKEYSSDIFVHLLSLAEKCLIIYTMSWNMMKMLMFCFNPPIIRTMIQQLHHENTSHTWSCNNYMLVELCMLPLSVSSIINALLSFASIKHSTIPLMTPNVSLNSCCSLADE